MVKIGREKTRPNTLVSAASVRGRTLADKVYCQAVLLQCYHELSARRQKVRVFSHGRLYALHRIYQNAEMSRYRENINCILIFHFSINSHGISDPSQNKNYDNTNYKCIGLQWKVNTTNTNDNIMLQSKIKRLCRAHVVNLNGSFEDQTSFECSCCRHRWSTTSYW